MRRLFPFALLALSGCASSPSGGPTTPPTNAPNRITVSQTLAQSVSNSFIYTFAFDDDNDSGDGPQAIITGSNSPNGVVSGSSRQGDDRFEGFTVLVRYRAGRFQAFRRTAQSNGQETLEEFGGNNATAVFVGTPSASGRTISFTLNLDARNVNGTYLFRREEGTTRLGANFLDTNFVNVSEERRDSQDNRIRPYDAFGQNTNGRTGNTYNTFDIRSTRTGGAAYTERNLFPTPEASDDVFNSDGTLPDAPTRGRLDISSFRIEVRRG